MGPRSRERGELPEVAAKGSHPLWLQWGRARGSAESSKHHRLLHELRPGFNGAALAGARRAFAPAVTIPPMIIASMGPRSRERGENGEGSFRVMGLKLQWGRARGSAERRQRH